MVPYCYWQVQADRHLQFKCDPQPDDTKIPPGVPLSHVLLGIGFIIAFTCLFIVFLHFRNIINTEKPKIIKSPSSVRIAAIPLVSVIPEPKDYVPPQVEQEEAEVTKECDICIEPLSRRIAFSPCGHATTCPDCAKELDRCPKCRTPIERRQKVFV